MDEILAVIIFSAYAAFILNLKIEGNIDLKYHLLEFIVFSGLFLASCYFGINGLVKLDILNILISIGALLSMKGFKL